MKRLLFLLTVVVLPILFLTCEKPDEEAPTVTILNLQESDVVFEIVTIYCIATDNEAVEKVELWLDGEYSGISDSSEPFKLEWNTIDYENRTYVVTVRVYDVNGNKFDSDPLNITVDNTKAVPQSVSINSILYENGGFTINWEKSLDTDFKMYNLDKSEDSQMNNYATIYSTEDINTVSFFDSNINPLIYQFYRVSVIDSFNFETKGGY